MLTPNSVWLKRHRFPPTTQVLWLYLVFLGSFGLVGLDQVRAQSEEQVTIYRDEFGTPHIFASSEAGVCFGHGYAQASDRLEELLKQYLRCTGTMSAAFGPEFLQDDYRQRLWRHAEIAKSRYGELDSQSRKLIEAYQAGIKHYLSTHPSQVPAWAPDIQPWMVVALSRYILWGWPEGEAADDLGRIGIQADPVEYRGSNQWLIAPSRTVDGAPLALIDPHLSWYGAFRFYEVRLYGGEIEFSGMSLLGMPLPLLGHNRYCSIAMTTGGPDTSDVYEEEVHSNDQRLYRYDGQWVPMEVREEVIEVLQGTERIQKRVTMEYTRHGPVVARREGKAYVFAIPYYDQIGMADQTYRMVIAKNLKEMQAALGMLQLMMQNIMIGTVDGDIYYVRNGRVPIRPEGYDHKKPVPGNTSKNEWKGIHPLEDLVQLHNPPQGYMQNCNISPQFMTKDCPLKPDPKRAYLFNGYQSETQAYDKPLHQRARSCLMQLEDMSHVTVEEAIDLALSPLVYGAADWQARLRTAWEKAPDTLRNQIEVRQMVELILNWNRRCDIDATGAIAYKYWKGAFGEEMKQWDRLGKPPSEQHSDDVLLKKIQEAIPLLLNDHGRLDIAYGEVYRVGRKGSDRTWPVAGGNNDHIATPRAIGFDPIPGTKRFLGKSGQTSPQVVQLSKPPKSWSVLPLGESDDPNSPHFDDQAEKLFGPGKMKPTYFLDKNGLLQRVQSKTVLLRRN